MKLDRLFRNFRGTVRFTAVGGHALRVPGQLAAQGISLHRVTPTDFGFEAEIASADYARAARLARKTGTRLRLVEKHGWRIWLFRRRGRTGLLAGLLAAAALMAVLSRFLWVVRIDGSLDHYTESQLREQLREFGLREGALVSGLDAGQIEQSMMIANDDLAYIAVNLHGSTADVIVRPRTRIDPEPGTGGQPANVVSLYDGVVRSIEVYSGTPQVKVGDTVQAGDLLIGAIVETANGRSSIKRASGKVLIEHEEDLAAAVPLEEIQLLPTGETRQVRVLHLCGMELALGVVPSGESRMESTSRTLTAFGTPLPVELEIREYTLLEEQEVTRTEEEARDLAVAQLEEQERTQLAGAEILDRALTGRVDGAYFLLQGHYLVLEDAALERPFEVNS